MNPDSFSSVNPGGNSFNSPLVANAPTGASYNPVPTAPLSPAPEPSKKPAKSSALKTVLLAFFILVSVASLGLLGYLYLEYTDLNSNVNEKISLAVAASEKEITKKLEDAFVEREKNPLKRFSGPVDYGELSFEFPKTWSVYVEEDASNGGDFRAYLNPDQVNPDPQNAVNALRVVIKNEAYDSAVATYKGYVENGYMTANVITVNGETANLFKTTSLNEWQGTIVLVRIRDKTVYLETDGDYFENDFKTILESVTYNQ